MVPPRGRHRCRRCSCCQHVGVRVRDHIALSTAAAIVVAPRLRRSVVAAWAASILIDVDHYLWFVVRHRQVDPVSAVRSFNSAQAPQHSETRLLHHPAFLLALAAASTRVPALRPPLLGMSFHVALDSVHRARSRRAQQAALRRDAGRCRICGSDDGVVVHIWRQPRLLPSYRIDNYVALCDGCHHVAHSGLGPAVADMDCAWDGYVTMTGLAGRRAAVLATSPP